VTTTARLVPDVLLPVPTVKSPPSGLRVIPVEECLTLLQTHRVGRLAWSVPAGPQLIAVSYQLHRGALVLRSRVGGVLSGLGNDRRVAFEIDELDEVGGTGWTVRAAGRAQVVTDPVALILLGQGDQDPWGAGGCPLYLRVSIDAVSGRVLTG
jgi:hypothetical protein